MTEKNTCVIINGDKKLFLSKNAIVRFKNDVKKCDVKNIIIEDDKYIQDGYIFNITHDDNIFTVNIITESEHLYNEKRKILKNKLKKVKYNRSNNIKKNLDSLKRTIPDKLFKSYVNLTSKYSFSEIPSPKDVMDDPKKFEKQISLLMEGNNKVSNDNGANNAIKKYFNILGNFMGIEPSELKLNNNTPEPTPVQNTELYNDVDTEDEDDEEYIFAEKEDDTPTSV
jgi:hypothetical protein